MFKLFKKRREWKRLRINDVIIDYDGLTVLEYEIYKVDESVGVALGRGIWEGHSYEKAFCLYYKDPRCIFSLDFDFDEGNPDPSRRYLIERR